MSEIKVPMGGLLNWGRRQGSAPKKRSSIANANTKYMYGKKHAPYDNHPFKTMFGFNAKQFILLHEQVIVTPDNPEVTMKESGIIIPGTVYQEEWYFTMGTVNTVGERVTEDIKPGDKILYDGFIAVPLEDDPFSRKEVVWQKNIWAVLREDEDDAS